MVDFNFCRYGFKVKFHMGCNTCHMQMHVASITFTRIFLLHKTDGYSRMATNCHRNSLRGGAATLMRNHRALVRDRIDLANFSIENFIEVCAVECLSFHLIVVCIYRPSNHMNNLKFILRYCLTKLFQS